MKLEGKVAVVTGGAGGIGRHICQVLAEEGAAVIVSDYGVTVDGREPNTAPAQEVVDSIVSKGGRAIPHFGSVTDWNVAKELVDLAVTTYGKLDVMVTVHGILRERMIFNMSEDEWDSVVDVHLKGTFNCVRHATVQMKAQKSGTILVVTSSAGLEGNPAQANYAAAKLGIVGLAWSTALAMGKYNVNCNVLAPSAATRMTARFSEITAKNRPADQIADARIVGVLAAALSTDQLRGVTGQIYSARGDRLARWSLPQEVLTVHRKEPWQVEQAIQAIVNPLGTQPLRRFKSMGLVEPVPPTQAPAGEDQ